MQVGSLGMDTHLIGIAECGAYAHTYAPTRIEKPAKREQSSRNADE